MRRILASALVVALVAATATAAILVTRPAPGPDWTIALCSAWIDKTNPEMPPYTYTDRCLDNDGTIIYAPK